MMRLYVWETDVLPGWTSGAALAVANSEEQARARILAAWDADNPGGQHPSERYSLARGITGPADRVLPLRLGFYCYGGD